MSNPKKVTLQWLRDILDKNGLGEIEIDVMSKTVQFMLDGHKLSSKRMSLEQAYDWLWAFIEGVRYQYAREREPFEGNKVVLNRQVPIYPRNHCEDCVFLGNHHSNSLFYCKQFQVCIVQWGYEAAKNHSREPGNIDNNEPDSCLIEAKRLAVEKGLIGE